MLNITDRRFSNSSTLGENRVNMLPGGSAAGLSTELRQLACMEVRGGNRAEVYRAELPGLHAWVSCRPLQPAKRLSRNKYLKNRITSAGGHSSIRREIGRAVD